MAVESRIDRGFKGNSPTRMTPELDCQYVESFDAWPKGQAGAGALRPRPFPVSSVSTSDGVTFLVGCPGGFGRYPQASDEPKGTQLSRYIPDTMQNRLITSPKRQLLWLAQHGYFAWESLMHVVEDGHVTP
jgi:hypothetical protein